MSWLRFSLKRHQISIVMLRSVLIILIVGVFVLYSCEAQQRCKGGINDALVSGCGSHCERTCENPKPRICILRCAHNVCRCQNGTVRRKSDQRCVPESRCRFHGIRPLSSIHPIRNSSHLLSH